MKIIYYSPHPNLNLTDPAGYGTHMREMIAAYRSLGHEVRPLIMGGTEARSSNEAPRPSLFKKVAKALIPARRWQTMKDKRLLDFDIQAYRKLLHEIESWKPDLIYERANYMQISGVKAAHRLDIPHILEMNSPYPEEKIDLEGPSRLLNLADKLEKEQLEKSTHILPVASSLRDHLIKKHGIFPGKFSVIPNAIDPNRAQVTPEAVEAIRGSYDLKGKKVIGWVGSIQPWHGIEVLIEAFAQIQEHFPDTVLMIVGSGENGIPVPASLSEGFVDKHVVLTGYVPHDKVFAHIAAMDICVLPNTKWYCSPIKIFEYGLMAKAIVATNHAAVLDVMTAGEDGLIIDPGKSSLVEAFKNLLESSSLRKEIGQNFQEKVLSKHIWLSNAQRVIDIYHAHTASIPR